MWRAVFSFQPLRRLSHDAEVRVLRNIDRPLQEAEIALHLDVGLQRGHVGEEIGAAGIFLAGEQPVREQLGTLFGELGRDLHRLVVVLGVEIPAHHPHRVLHEVDHGGAVLVQEAFACRPHDHLRRADRIALGEQRPCQTVELGVVGERRHARDQVGLLLQEDRLHGRQRRLEHRIVALVLEPVLAQHRPHGDVDRAAGGIGCDHLALEVLDLLDRAVLQHEVLRGEVAGHAVLELVGDHPQIGHAGILDGDAERRIGMVADLEFVRRHRGDQRRGAVETGRLEDIGLAVVDEQIGLLRQHRRPVRRRDDPAHSKLQGVGGMAGAGGQQCHSCRGRGERKVERGHGPSGLVLPFAHDRIIPSSAASCDRAADRRIRGQARASSE